MIFWPPTKTGWKIIGLVAVLVLMFGGYLFLSKTIQKAWFNHKMTQANANLVKELDKLSDIQTNQAAKTKELEQANVDEAVQKEKVIQAAKDAETAAKAEQQAQTAANQAVSNVEAVNAKDFSNSTLEDANKARCRAFPDNPECQ